LLKNNNKNINRDKYIHIIILGYGNFLFTTQKCLESLIKEVNQEDVLITVIDNGSLDNSAKLQKDFLEIYPTINSVYLPQNLGFAGGMNYGASLVNAEWVILMGSDTIFMPGSFAIFYKELIKTSIPIGIVGPVTNEAGNGQKLAFNGSNACQVFQEFKEIIPDCCGLATTIYRADFFCVAIRKKIWDKLNGLSLSYGKGYYEDFDFCMRAKDLGVRIVMLEDVLVYHAGSSSFHLDPQQKELIKRNKKIFVKKFPFVQLRHRREDNLQVLKEYLELDSETFYSTGLQSLIKNRLWIAENDVPRSVFKKYIWQYRVRKIRQEFVNKNFNDTIN
jgi:GT2 family glycosyltransferase